MPNFDAILVGGDVVPWVDQESSTLPSRLNPDLEHLPTYHRYVLSGGTVHAAIHAIVGGVVAPLDVALGGDLFSATLLEWSGASLPAIQQPAGQTSVIGLNLLEVGHYCLLLMRSNGGGIIVHFDVEE